MSATALAMPISAAEMPGARSASSEAVYAARCDARALLFANGLLSLHEAVDELQTYAEKSGLVDRLGQDEVQRIMGVAFAAVDLLPGPEEPAADQISPAQLSSAAPDPRETVAPRSPAYRTAASTIAAFRYVTGLDDADYLTRWLANHPADAPELFKIWKGKRC
jgi:hypothetical protein